MIREAAYAEGFQAAWGVFSKEAAPFKPPNNMQVFRGPRVAAQTGSAPVMGAVAQGGGGPVGSASPGQMLPQNVGPGVTKKPAVPAPAAPAGGATPAAPAGAAATPAAAAASPTFMQSLKEQAPGALLNTGLMMGIPMAMQAFSGSGNQNQ